MLVGFSLHSRISHYKFRHSYVVAIHFLLLKVSSRLRNRCSVSKLFSKIFSKLWCIVNVWFLLNLTNPNPFCARFRHSHTNRSAILKDIVVKQSDVKEESDVSGMQIGLQENCKKGC